MRPALLDVNLLIALLWEEHIHHRAASAWFAAKRQSKWATCPITEAGFVRVSVQRRIADADTTVEDAIQVLAKACVEPHHVFWSHQHSLTEILPEIRERVIGHQQITDAILLDLAIRNGGALATLDRRTRALLPDGSPHHSAIEIVALP